MSCSERTVRSTSGTSASLSSTRRRPPLIAGHAADRFDRRRLLAAVYAAFALVAAGLFACPPRSGAVPVWPIYTILFFHAVARSFGQPASSALLPDVVPADMSGAPLR